MAIVDLIARVDGTDPVELDPLYGVIDPDVLNSLCDSSPGFTSLEFAYQGHRVTVEATGEAVEISLADSEPVADGSGNALNTEPSL